MRKIRVLVVGAEIVNCESIVTKLHNTGYDLFYARNGEQIETVRDVFVPDIVVFCDYLVRGSFDFLDTFGTLIPILSTDNTDTIRKQLPDYIEYADGVDEEDIMKAIHTLTDPLRQDLAWLNGDEEK